MRHIDFHNLWVIKFCPSLSDWTVIMLSVFTIACIISKGANGGELLVSNC